MGKFLAPPVCVSVLVCHLIRSSVSMAVAYARFTGSGASGVLLFPVHTSVEEHEGYSVYCHSQLSCGFWGSNP